MSIRSIPMYTYDTISAHYMGTIPVFNDWSDMTVAHLAAEYPPNLAIPPILRWRLLPVAMMQELCRLPESPPTWATQTCTDILEMYFDEEKLVDVDRIQRTTYHDAWIVFTSVWERIDPDECDAFWFFKKNIRDFEENLDGELVQCMKTYGFLDAKSDNPSEYIRSHTIAFLEMIKPKADDLEEFFDDHVQFVKDGAYVAFDIDLKYGDINAFFEHTNKANPFELLPLFMRDGYTPYGCFYPLRRNIMSVVRSTEATEQLVRSSDDCVFYYDVLVMCCVVALMSHLVAPSSKVSLDLLNDQMQHSMSCGFRSVYYPDRVTNDLDTIVHMNKSPREFHVCMG